MVLAEHNHSARLRASGAFGVLRDKTYLVPDAELFKAAVRDTVAVKVDLGAVNRGDKTAILIGKQARDAPVVGDRVQLHLAAPLANMVFERPADGIERVPNRYIGILMRMMGCSIAADDDLAARYTEVYANVEQIALSAAKIEAFDDDPAGGDPIEEAFELLGAAAYACRYRFRAVHVTERYLKRNLHRFLLSAVITGGFHC